MHSRITKALCMSISILFFSLSATDSSYEISLAEAQEKALIKQPLSLQEACYKLCASFFTQATLCTKAEKKNLINIKKSLPDELLQELAAWCLQGEFVQKFLPKALLYDSSGKLSEDHRYVIRYGIWNNRKLIVGLNLEVSFPCIHIEVYDRSNQCMLVEDNSALLSDVAISPNGKYCAYLAKKDEANFFINIRTIATNELIALKQECRPTEGKVFFYDDATLITGMKEHVLIYKIETGEETLIPSSHLGELAMIKNEFLLYQPERHDHINVYDLNLNKTTALLKHGAEVTALAASKSNFIATGSADGSATLWQIKDNGQLAWGKTFQQEAMVNYIKFDPSSSFFITASPKHPVAIWDIESCKMLHEIPHQNGAGCELISWASDTNEIVVKDSDGGGWNSENFFSYSPNNLRLGLMLKKHLMMIKR